MAGETAVLKLFINKSWNQVVHNSYEAAYDSRAIQKAEKLTNYNPLGDVD